MFYNLQACVQFSIPRCLVNPQRFNIDSNCSISKCPAQLSPAEAQELIDAFEIFDKNKDGTISIDELGSILRAVGQNPSNAKLEEIMKKADKNGDGVLNKAEYVNLISSYMVDPEVMKAELREAFMTFDKAKKGYLNLEQMTKALRCLGEPLSDIEIKQLMEIADTNHDGKVDVDEFVNCLCQRI
ncbi:neo-calmodulin-like [Ostrea edulis]|uniref:neo-calmodulin-like n=1 Tax=Ostrea edulis TaxID=37623 RepID=UPI00209552AF|nr:neo-calmodulin-like [Ostrea edulis]